MEVCGYCGEQRGEKMGCCGENHWGEVDDDPRPCECRQGECESKSDKVCRMSGEVGRQRGRSTKQGAGRCGLWPR